MQVLRSSTVPVLSIPPGFSALPRNVVAGVDFSPASVRAAETALLLVDSGGTLTLLHVLSPLQTNVPLRHFGGRDPATSIQALFGRLRDMLRPYVPHDVTIETQVKADLHTHGILEAAEGMGADLVAVGTHGPRLLERLCHQRRHAWHFGIRPPDGGTATDRLAPFEDGRSFWQSTRCNRSPD